MILTNILFVIIIASFGFFIWYKHKNDKYVDEIILTLLFYSMRFGDFTSEEIWKWFEENIQVEEEYNE
jgi:hypothetical protein